MQQMTTGQLLKLWFTATRPWAFPASIVPILLGSAYAYYANPELSFNWWHFALALIGGMAIHAGCNMVNDAYDFKYGVDREGTFGGTGLVVSGQLRPGQLLYGAAIAFLIGIAVGAYFIGYFTGSGIAWWPLLLIGAVGIIAAIFYTATPYAAKFHALGEPLVFLMMGVLMVLGAYFVQTGSLNWLAFWASIPVSFTVAAILQANDTRDIVDDRTAGITTISTLLGPQGARVFYMVLISVPYVVLLILVVAMVLPPWALIALLPSLLAFKLCRDFWLTQDERPAALRKMDELSAMHHMAFGVLLSFGVLLGGIARHVA
jgi:1,4-dihydroxy-2-naphthoate octaprenyltransferase